VVQAQDSYNFVQFYINPSLINPSFTGIDGQPVAFLSYKKQWMGISGTPSIGNLSVQKPFSSGLSTGLNLSNDRRGLVNTTSIIISNSYFVPISAGNFIRFGISIGGGWNKVDINSLNFGSTGDDVLADLMSSNFQLLGNAGLSFHSGSFQIGAAIPNIFQPAYITKDAFTISKVKPFESIIFQSSYRYYFSHDLYAFEPYLIYRLNGSIPSQLEAAGIFHLHNLAWAGVSYKQNFGISALIGFKFNRLTGLGYSYTMKNTGTNELSRPSHEIQLGFLFGIHQKKIPIFSFINSEKEKVKKKNEKQEFYATNKSKGKTQSGTRLRVSGSDQLEETKSKSKPQASNKSKTSVSKAEAAKVEAAKVEATKVEATKVETAKIEAAKIEAAKVEATKVETAKIEAAKVEATKVETAKIEAAKVEAAKIEATKVEAAKLEAAKVESAKVEAAKIEAAKIEAAKIEVAKVEATKVEAAKVEAAKVEAAKIEAAKIEAAKIEAAKVEAAKVEAAKVEAAKVEAAKAEALKVTNDKGKTSTAKPDFSTPDKFASKADSLQHHDELDKIKRLTDHAENPTEEHNEEGHPHAERHEFVVRGDHVSELDLGDYVIVGVFKAEPNARHFSDELKKLGFSEVNYGYLTKKGIWYVHFGESSDIEEAKSKRNKYRKMRMFKDAWLLTVHQ
jgi:type IX secretion system PorP/SprF family membrane protein